MKILKSAAIAFSLTVAMGSFSTSAVAESDPGRISYAPTDVIAEISNRIDTAVHEIDNGAEDAEVAALIKKARDFTKEMNANDKVAREMQKVRKHLKAAEKSAKTADLTGAKEHLGAARQANEGLKGFL